MKIKSIICSLSIAVLVLSCGPKDADIQKEIAAKMGDMPGMQVTVKDGVATISGVCKDAACKESCESIAKGVKGVKSVVNNCEIAAPEPVITTAPVEINSDAVLNTEVSKVVETYSGVKATVLDGVVTLKGEIKRDQLPILIQSIQELKPKKVENQLTIK
ncbi:BON domain-containing protein [Flavobacterium sp.]|uniref:BON domain-containing protein n=1 Tax=Flavobacterium sp. TaxID=239 RepID=UPI002C3FC626|nr:BON domain-containing protein [Flavobacterium sp.]HSD06292.1 BON domain-containing protein [Flavobacterium sp.]